MSFLIPFALGVTFMALACLQHTHSVRGLWQRSVLTSICLGGIQYLMVRWAAKGDVAFWFFQVGSCVGAGLGSYLSSRMKSYGRGFCGTMAQREEVDKRVLVQPGAH